MKEHADLLISTLEAEFKDTIETSKDLMKRCVTTWLMLWTLFQPGIIALFREDGQDVALKVQSTKYGHDAQQNPCFYVQGACVDWDGVRFGTVVRKSTIYPFAGTTKIHHLAIFPIEYHPKHDQCKSRLIERGAKVESMAGEPHYTAYKGMGWCTHPLRRTREKHSVDGRIVIDNGMFNRSILEGVFVQSLKDEKSEKDSDEANGEDQVNGHQDNNAEDDALWGATASGEPEDDYYEVSECSPRQRSISFGTL